jgi:hypothetical protein
MDALSGALTALFNFPKGITNDSKGNLFIAGLLKVMRD